MVVTGQTYSRARLPKARPNLRDAGRRCVQPKLPDAPQEARPTSETSGEATAPPVAFEPPSLLVTTPPDSLTREDAPSGVVPSILHLDDSLPASSDASRPLAAASPTCQNPVVQVLKPATKTVEEKEFLTQKRRQYNKKSNVPPDRTKMTMLDLIYWNPPGNRMKSAGDDGENGVIELGKERLEEEAVDAGESVPEEDGEEEEMPGPRVRVDADGNIVLDEESLVIRRPSPKKDCSKEPVVYEKCSNVSYTSFRKAKPRKLWSERETARFYKALSICGTDFSLMTNMIPQRTRQELKSKYKHEERHNWNLVDKAMSESLQFDTSGFEEDLLNDFRELVSNYGNVPSNVKSGSEKQRGIQSAGNCRKRTGRERPPARGRNPPSRRTIRRPTYEISDDDEEKCQEIDGTGIGEDATDDESSVIGTGRKRGASWCEEGTGIKKAVAASVPQVDEAAVGLPRTEHRGEEILDDEEPTVALGGAGMPTTMSRGTGIPASMPVGPDPQDVARQLLSLSGDGSPVLSPGQLVFLASRTPEQEEVVHVYLVSSPPVNDREVHSPGPLSPRSCRPSDDVLRAAMPGQPLDTHSVLRAALAGKITPSSVRPLGPGSLPVQTRLLPNSTSFPSQQVRTLPPNVVCRQNPGSAHTSATSTPDHSAMAGTRHRLQNFRQRPPPPGSTNFGSSVTPNLVQARPRSSTPSVCRSVTGAGCSTTALRRPSPLPGVTACRTLHPKIKGIERLRMPEKVSTLSSPTSRSNDPEPPSTMP